MSEEVTSERGRPSRYDRDFVRDISVQVLVEFYNERQGTLRELILKDPEYVSKMRTKAASLDPTVLTWLTAMEYVKPPYVTSQFELTFRAWCLQLDPPLYPKQLTAWSRSKTAPDYYRTREKSLRELMAKHFTPDHWRFNCRRWVDAIERVRRDQSLTLKIPPTIDPALLDEDEFL